MVKEDSITSLRMPAWLVKPFPKKASQVGVGKILSRWRLNTVCRSAQCPNLCECYSQGTATFMIMGDICTRNCMFCAVSGGIPGSLEADEPVRVALAVKDMGLSHIVVTSVTRDDLPDGGAMHFAATINAIRKVNPDTTVEVLVPDFKGSQTCVETVVKAVPDIFAHNLETVPGLYKNVRPMADYRRSLEVLKSAKDLNKGIYTKSGIMLGLGETEAEIIAVMQDLRIIDCDFLTLGQYLSPSEDHLPVNKFISPEKFEDLAQIGQKMGFSGVAAGPFVRSSYHAKELLNMKEASIQSPDCSLAV
ncbi:MAG: lipoyl synthase [Desulfobacterium sp.]|nr:lipoyl synthase [Desulfobacterium sp.]MBU3948696.1 lipoyl synthase [Pseudomonadota bacterium]MBU4011412.1 lipoyl synthase [Pseudomonadota bacterium]MBU4037089.1 lipoyl synthase [Pseudomonadota bacterium]